MTATGKKCKRGAVPIKMEGKIAKSPKASKTTPTLGLPSRPQNNTRYWHSSCHLRWPYAVAEMRCRICKPDELLQWIVSGADSKLGPHDHCQAAWSHDSCLNEVDEQRTRDVTMDDDHQSAAGTEDHDEAATQSEA
eukprot:2200414-Rhodomonas_salina.1